MSMPKKFNFTVQLLKGEGDTAYFAIPFSVSKEFGKKGLVKVKASFDGIEYRGSLMPMGDGAHCLGIRKDIRKKIGKQAGDTVNVTLEEDSEERKVDVPSELQEYLDSNKKAKEFFDSLSYTNRKEYARWIAEAKKEETKLSRLEKAKQMLLHGIKHP
jgi:hypothetical protein